MVLERLGGSLVRLPIEFPVEMGDVALARLRLLEVRLHPVDICDLTYLRLYEGPEVFVCSCYGSPGKEFLHCVVNVAAIRKNGLVA